jgi:hypothetical protein
VRGSSRHTSPYTYACCKPSPLFRGGSILGVHGTQARVSVYSSARTIQLKTPHRHSPDNEWAETLAGRHAVTALNDDPSG